MLKKHTSPNFTLLLCKNKLYIFLPIDYCELPYIGEVDCYGEYGILSEDETNYCIGWKTSPCPEFERVYNYSSEAWVFTSGQYV